jgi:hypothetical protein
MLRLLQNGFCVERFHYGGDLLGLMADYDDGFFWFERRASAKDVFDKGAAASAVEHFRKARFQPGALSRGENDDGQIIRRHGFDSFCGSSGDFANVARRAGFIGGVRG